MRAMIGWRQYVRNAVTWNGRACVVDVDAKAVELTKPHLEGARNDKVDSKGYSQWIGVWKTEIGFSFKSLDMKNI